MRRHEAKKAELAKKEKDALHTLRNHSKLQSILAQLKDVQENMVDDVRLKLSSPEVGVHSPTCNFMVTEKEPDVDGRRP
ncbi:hypothetical protein EB796_023603 [Bugula neritina]|uniref:Uncharacterized protein n=1 Tax=Bugula neritina TaxID=10212 RepID=A0A7J7IXG3_BUGNE|nr:hypothetical protein EB796_023603 [Bugula neritina]